MGSLASSPSPAGPLLWPRQGQLGLPTHAPLCCALFSQDPRPLPYLRHDQPYTFDINLSVALKGTAVGPEGVPSATAPRARELQQGEGGVACSSLGDMWALGREREGGVLSSKGPLRHPHGRTPISVALSY